MSAKYSLIKCWSKRQVASGVRAGIFLHLDVVMLSGQGQVGASVIIHGTGQPAARDSIERNL